LDLSLGAKMFIVRLLSSKGRLLAVFALLASNEMLGIMRCPVNARIGWFVCLTMLFGGAAAHANLVVNGNFASGNFSPWTVTETGTGGSPRDFGVTDGVDVPSGSGIAVPNTGDTYGAYFNPGGGIMDLSQTVTIPTTGSYTLTFALKTATPPDQDMLTIYLGGAPVPVFSTIINPPTPYAQFNTVVSAQAGPQVIDFQFTPGASAMFLDDVSMYAGAAVPEPSTLMAGVLALLPFGHCAVRQLRKKLQAA
jgi:hypothetical protein